MENDPKSVYFILKRKNHISIYADGKYPKFSRSLKICKTKFSLLKRKHKNRVFASFSIADKFMIGV